MLTSMGAQACYNERASLPPIGHADLAPKRKPDPNNFPWKVLADRGFGLWYDQVLKMPPPTFDPILALRIIGYDTSNVGANEAEVVSTESEDDRKPVVLLRV